MNNPMEIINELRKFLNNYRGNNAKEEFMQIVQQNGFNQNQLNDLQNQASYIYQVGQMLGLFR